MQFNWLIESSKNYHYENSSESWEVGDEIAVGSTDFTQDHTEVFVLVECPECSANQVKLDRTSKFHHWGRIDSRTGIDQRAPVGHERVGRYTNFIRTEPQIQLTARRLTTAHIFKESFQFYEPY